MKVLEVMTNDVECAKPTDTLMQTAQRMRSLDVGCLPVCEASGRVLGVITDRDIAIRAVAEGLMPDRTAVSAVMSPDTAYCFENDNVRSAASLMESLQIRRLAVLNEEHQLVGIISLGDIAVRVGETTLSGQTLEEISESEPKTADQNNH